jgi:uncharacterized Rmd1/YagE family protein
VPAHSFSAVAFVENLALKDALPAFPGARTGPHELVAPCGAGACFVYPFGAVVFSDVPPAQRDETIARLRRSVPKLTEQVVREDFTVREDPGGPIRFADGALVVDALTPERAEVVALTIAQSAAMEYYERLVDALAVKTATFVDRLEAKGSVSFRVRPLHRFIGEAVSTRSEVLSVLHLLDKPDAVWDDPGLDRIYADLRSEFDLADRFEALETKLRSVQEALELVLGVARDRRVTALETAVILLIAVELVLALLRH